MLAYNEEFFRKHDVAIVLYCFGAYGIQTYFLLKENNVPVECFGDIDPNKWGYAIDHINCIPYHDILKKPRDNTLIIVCNEKPDKIVDCFCREGFLHVTTTKEIRKYFQIAYTNIAYENKLDEINFLREQLYHAYQGNEIMSMDSLKGELLDELKKTVLDQRIRFSQMGTKL